MSLIKNLNLRGKIILSSLATLGILATQSIASMPTQSSYEKNITCKDVTQYSPYVSMTTFSNGRIYEFNPNKIHIHEGANYNLNSIRRNLSLLYPNEITEADLVN